MLVEPPAFEAPTRLTLAHLDGQVAVGSLVQAGGQAEVARGDPELIDRAAAQLVRHGVPAGLDLAQVLLGHPEPAGCLDLAGLRRPAPLAERRTGVVPGRCRDAIDPRAVRRGRGLDCRHSGSSLRLGTRAGLVRA